MNIKIEGFAQPKQEVYIPKIGDLLEDNYSGTWLVTGYHTDTRDTRGEVYFFNFSKCSFCLLTDQQIADKKFKLLNPNYKVILSNGTID